MKRGRILSIVAVALSFAAMVISQNLLRKHVTGTSGSAWFDAGCWDDAPPGGANCAAVLASPYGYFPPKFPDEPAGRGHLPVAFLGLLYYSALFVWFIGVGRPSTSRRRLHALPTFFVGLGLAASGYYTVVMFRVLTEWCSWCLVTHALNVMIAVCVVLTWPRRERTSAGAANESDAPSAVVQADHPSARTLCLTLGLIATLFLAELNMWGLTSWRRRAESANSTLQTCIAAVKRVKADADSLYENWQRATNCDIALRPDESIRTTAPLGTTTLDVVVFSDFECPSCRRFAEFVETKAQPLFANGLRVIFKHYPIDTTCNARASRTMHRHACDGVRMAEAARIVGGNDAFWRAHDYLFGHRDQLAVGAVSVEAVAAAIGLDVDAMRSAQTSPKVEQRLTEDIQQADACKIRGTPAVFVDGKNVDSLASTEVGFWDKLADQYWRDRGVPRPETTNPTPATKDQP